jgi:hypothetical protein
MFTSNSVVKEKVERLCVVNASLDDGILNISADVNITLDDLRTVTPSDKGNRTIVYKKWTDGGITFQLTGYVTSKAMTDMEALEHTKKVVALEKAQAEYLSMMGDPEVAALIAKKKAQQQG